jgi:hypothetical protein
VSVWGKILGYEREEPAPDLIGGLCALSLDSRLRGNDKKKEAINDVRVFEMVSCDVSMRSGRILKRSA